MEPLVDVGLQGLEQLVELGSDLFQELVFLEIVLKGAIEALDKAAVWGRPTFVVRCSMSLSFR